MTPGERFGAYRRVLLMTTTPLAALGLWEVAARLGVVDSRFFPPPLAILAAAWHMVTTPELVGPLLDNLAVTARRVGLGYGVGVLAGLVVGWAMGLSGRVRDALSAIVYGTYPTPKIAVFPLLIVLFGLGEQSKIAMIALGTFYMVCINTINGIVYSNGIYAEVARAFSLPWHVQQFRITLPAALPSVVAGLKLGFGQALILVISVEFVGSSDGLGYYIWNSWQVLDIIGMFVGLAIVAVVGGLTVVVGDYAERKLMPWSQQA